MSNLKLKQLLKKQSILLPFLIVCSLFISEKALAVYDINCCLVYGCDENIEKEDYIQIVFKFFEYEPKQGLQNSYLKDFEVKYSTDAGRHFSPLMTASTQDQASKTWAWIRLKDKKVGSKINLFMCNRNKQHVKSSWKEGTRPKLEVCADLAKTKHAWLGIDWYPMEELYKVTHIQVKAKWYNHEMKITEDVLLDYNVTPNKEKLNSNCLNAFPKEEIKLEDKNNTVKAYKEANAIVVEGALNENIQVYTTTGALVKSLVADCDALQIPVLANQLYIVKVGKGCYKVAL